MSTLGMCPRTPAEQASSSVFVHFTVVPSQHVGCAHFTRRNRMRTLGMCPQTPAEQASSSVCVHLTEACKHVDCVHFARQRNWMRTLGVCPRTPAEQASSLVFVHLTEAYKGVGLLPSLAAIASTRKMHPTLALVLAAHFSQTTK